MLTRADTVLRAHEMGAGLTDVERIALGVTLAETVLNPEYAPYLAYAAGSLRDHAAALADLDPEQPGGPHTGQTITHEQIGLPGSSAPCGAEPPGPCIATSSSRAQHCPGTISRALARLSDSWIGDFLGAVSLAVVFVALLFLPLFFGH